MAVDNVYEGGVISVHTTATDPKDYIGGIQSCNVSPGTTVEGGPAAGETYNSFHSVRSQRPVISFTTRNLTEALGISGVAGAKIDDGVGDGLWYYNKVRVAFSTYAATADAWQMADGFLVPRTLEAGYGEEATLTYDCMGISTGAAPLVRATGETPPTAITDYSLTEAFSLYDVKLAGVQLDQATRVSIDFGVNVEYIEGTATQATTAELIWPQYLSTTAIVPVITITTTDVNWYATVGQLGAAVTGENDYIRLAKMADQSSYVAAASAVHLKLALEGFTIVETPTATSGKDAAQATYTLRGGYDGTNAPIAHSFAAIT
jgi:hypothetical protein